MPASSAEPNTSPDLASTATPVSIGRIACVFVAVCMWILAMFGVLQLADADLGMPHLVCGPWGCGPRTEALLACHGFWLLLLAPPAAFAATRGTTATVKLVAAIATTAAGTGVVFILGQQAVVTFAQSGAGTPSHFLHRCQFEIATLVELPLIQLLLIGTIGFAYAGWRNRRFRAAQRTVTDQ